MKILLIGECSHLHNTLKRGLQVGTILLATLTCDVLKDGANLAVYAYCGICL